MLDQDIWTRVINIIPYNNAIPSSVDDNLVADLDEVKMLFNSYWAQDSAHTYFPFLNENICRLMFRRFLYRCEDSSVAIDTSEGNTPVIKGMVMAIAALSGRFLCKQSADIYFTFACRIVDSLPITFSIDYVVVNTLLVRYVPYLGMLKLFRHVLLSPIQTRVSFSSSL